MKQLVIFLFTCLVCISSFSQKRWDGGGFDNQWSNATNWAPNGVPATTDDVILDNTLFAATYTVILSNTAVSVNSITITPAGVNNITLELPVSNTLAPGLSVTGPGNAVTVNNGGILKNSSGAAAGDVFVITNTFALNNGGRYIHNTARGHADLLNHTVLAYESFFEFNVPEAAYFVSVASRTFGNLIFNGAAAGTITYTGSGVTNMTVVGTLTINTGATFNSTLNSNILLYKDLIVNGTLDLSPAEEGVTQRSLIFYGQPSVLSGTGNITMTEDFRNIEINSGATLTLQRNLTLGTINNSLIINSLARLRMGAYVIDGDGVFNMQPDCSINIGSELGINFMNIGNVQTEVRNFISQATYEYDGTGDQIMGKGPPGNIKNLVVNKPSGKLTASKAYRVTGQLQLLSGVIVTNGVIARLTFAGTGIVSPVNNYGFANQGWEQSFISGPLEFEISSTAEQTLPIGKEDRYAPIRIQKGNNTPVTYTAEYIGQANADVTTINTPPLDHISRVEYWTVISDNPFSVEDDAQVSLSWRPSSVVGTTELERGDLRVAHWEDQGMGHKWEQEGANPVITGDANYGFIKSDNLVANFAATTSLFTLASRSIYNILPWKLKSLSGINDKGISRLDWKISGEENITHYVIERSRDRRNFAPIATIASQMSKTDNVYKYADANPPNGHIYYRIRITDIQKQHFYSPVIKIDNISAGISIYPNPVTSHIYINLSGPCSNYKIEVVNNTGRVMRAYSKMICGTDKIDAGGLPKGQYFIRVYTDKNVFTLSFLKQ